MVAELGKHSARRATTRACLEHWPLIALNWPKPAPIPSYLTHAMAELQELDPQIGEEETLADERLLLMNAEKIAADLR